MKRDERSRKSIGSLRLLRPGHSFAAALKQRVGFALAKSETLSEGYLPIPSTHLHFANEFRNGRCQRAAAASRCRVSRLCRSQSQMKNSAQNLGA